MRTDPCKKCNSLDFYVKGSFAYCRPCHNEANRRYLENKRMGVKPDKLRAPSRSLEYMLSQGERGSNERNKTHCAQGHPYAGDNVRYSSQRGGKVMRRMCLTCERNAKRVKYGLLPEPNPVRLTDMLDN